MNVSDGVLDELYQVAYAVAFRILGDSGDAQDCAQEATARALSRWARVCEYAEPWVVRVSANLALGMLRKRKRLIVGLSGLEEPLQLDGFDRADSRLDVAAALLELPQRQRQALVLRYVGDLSEQEAALALGCSPASVKTHVKRGLARMRNRLAEQAFKLTVDREAK